MGGGGGGGGGTLQYRLWEHCFVLAALILTNNGASSFVFNSVLRVVYYCKKYFFIFTPQAGRTPIETAESVHKDLAFHIRVRCTWSMQKIEDRSLFINIIYQLQEDI